MAGDQPADYKVPRAFVLLTVFDELQTGSWTTAGPRNCARIAKIQCVSERSKMRS